MFTYRSWAFTSCSWEKRRWVKLYEILKIFIGTILIKDQKVVLILNLKESINSYQVYFHFVPYCCVLYCVVLYCSVLYCTVLNCTELHCTVLYCTVLYCTVLNCTVLYCTILYCTLLYCIVLYCTVLYNTVQHYPEVYCAVL